jgi:hypothetical protein
MNDYIVKYLKYKNKYLSLRNTHLNMFGGSSIKNNINNNNTNTNIILCGTHNNRLECYFKSINKDYPNKAFNNCVIIKCYKDINNNVKFNMIYEGESTGDDKISICSLTNGCWDIVSFNNYFNNYSYNINLPNNTEIYLIRHALGVHNKMNVVQKIFNTKKDSILDIMGIDQAERAGLFLKGYIKKFYKNITMSSISFMASHLIRTQQTIGIIMKMLEIKDTIYIVPCSHELIFSNNCDSSILEYIPIASNMPNCTNNSGTCNMLTNFSNIERYNTYSININWDYYMEFYKLNKKCKDTNIISEIIKLYSLRI